MVTKSYFKKFLLLVFKSNFLTTHCSIPLFLSKILLRTTCKQITSNRIIQYIDLAEVLLGISKNKFRRDFDKKYFFLSDLN